MKSDPATAAAGGSWMITMLVLLALAFHPAVCIIGAYTAAVWTAVRYERFYRRRPPAR